MNHNLHTKEISVLFLEHGSLQFWSNPVIFNPQTNPFPESNSYHHRPRLGTSWFPKASIVFFVAPYSFSNNLFSSKDEGTFLTNRFLQKYIRRHNSKTFIDGSETLSSRTSGALCSAKAFTLISAMAYT